MPVERRGSQMQLRCARSAAAGGVLRPWPDGTAACSFDARVLYTLAGAVTVRASPQIRGDPGDRW